MSPVLPILGTVFAAFWVWLAVRILNRREQWAMQLAALVGSWALIAATVYAMFVVWGLCMSVSA